MRPHTSIIAIAVGLTATSPAAALQPVVAVRGVAYDSLRGEPLADALVMIIGAHGSRTTDARGRFAFDSVAPGTLTVIVQHPTLDSVGLRGLAKRVEVSAATGEVRLAIPSIQTLWRRVCGGEPPRDSGFVYGTIRDVSSGAPVADAEVGLSWINTAYDRRDGIEQTRVSGTTRTDASGTYVVCGVPTAQWLRVTAAAPRAAGEIQLPPAELRVQRRDLFIGPSREQDSTSVGSIVGRLFDQDGAPYSEARIVLDDQTETRSRGDGRFAFHGVRAGTRRVEVMSIGIVPIVMSVDVFPRDSAAIRLELRRVTTLDVVRVTASRRGRALAEAIEERRRIGFGYSMTLTELHAHASFATVLTDFPGLRVVNRGADYDVFVSDGRGGECAPEMWVDGARMALTAVQMLHPRDVMAVEVFPRAGAVPIEFRRTERLNYCGAVMVWTFWAFNR